MLKYTFFLFTLIQLSLSGHSSELKQRLTRLSDKFDFKITELKTDTFFEEKFLIELSQPLDHGEDMSETFTQRIYLSHRGFNNPVVFITEGYAAGYAQNPRYINELSGILEANQVCVEHRYFGNSIPKPIEWKYLTIKNAAADHHQIITILSEIYGNKWISTGISKGGQTALFHRYFYPDDVDATVGYVCPVNFSKEDKRVYRFLEQVGDSITRNKIYAFQYKLLKDKAKYLAIFRDQTEKKRISFNMSITEAFELTVLEYSFAFWQWGMTPVDSIPDTTASPVQIISHLGKVAGFDWVSEKGIERMQPFFYQAMLEIGFYGYDITPFQDFVSFKENPGFDFTLPEGIEVHYDPLPMQQVDCFIRHQADNILLIYGENDPWSATGAEITWNNDVVKIIKPDGSHMTRIKNLPETQKELAISTLKRWLSE
ncbi:MAG: aminopeptidase [Bacteroidales bacterium]|nr:aminopeptidase [Bacteroidales bacterium]